MIFDAAARQIGDPVKVRTHVVVLYGRVTGFAGDQCGGAWPQLVVYTPGGSKIEVGIAWVTPLEPDEMPILEDYEHTSKCPQVYDGKIILVEGKWRAP